MTSETGHKVKKILLRILLPLFMVGVGWLAYDALKAELAHESIANIKESLLSIGPLRLLIATGFMALSYCVFGLYDASALKLFHAGLSVRKGLLAGFLGGTISQNTGMMGLGGYAVRVKLYTNWQLPAKIMAQLFAFLTLAQWLGLLALSGVMFLLFPEKIPAMLHLPFKDTTPLALILLIPILLYFLMAFLLKKPVTIGKKTLQPPRKTTLFTQLVLSCASLAAAGMVQWALLPEGHGIHAAVFLSIYLLAQIGGKLSQVPFGLGVYEAVILVLLPNTYDNAAIVGGMVAYRVLYNMIPLLIAVVVWLFTLAHGAGIRKD